MFSPFVVLLAAIGVEVGATTILPRTRGFHDLPWSLVVLGGYALSIWLLAVVVRQMSVSVAYAVWSGLGTAAIAAGRRAGPRRAARRGQGCSPCC